LKEPVGAAAAAVAAGVAAVELVAVRPVTVRAAAARVPRSLLMGGVSRSGKVSIAQVQSQPV
jgi:hypothetical protein